LKTALSKFKPLSIQRYQNQKYTGSQGFTGPVQKTTTYASEENVEMFVENLKNVGKYESVVDLLLMYQGSFSELPLDICIQYNIKISEVMAENMTRKISDITKNEKKNMFLKKLAFVCKDQGNFHLAYKKFKESGEQVNAMKCLLKTGETENIISSAHEFRNKLTHMLAANYLQNQDWHNDFSIMKNIVQFYTEAQGYKQLVRFFNACSQIEIDEYGDYDKALDASLEATKYINLLPENQCANLIETTKRIENIKCFVEAKNDIKSNPVHAENIVIGLLEENDIESAIREGDCLSLLINYYHNVKRYDEAYELLQRMYKKGITPENYVDTNIIQYYLQSR